MRSAHGRGGHHAWGSCGEGQLAQLRGWASEPTRGDDGATLASLRWGLHVPGWRPQRSHMSREWEGLLLAAQGMGAMARCQTREADEGQTEMGFLWYAAEFTFYSRSC